MWPCKRTTAQWASLALACFLFPSCSRPPDHSAPNITFDRVPRADIGGPDKVDTIAGHATGVAPTQQIVLYTRSEEIWWIQPYTDKPYTKIERNSTWKNQTHLGTEYAALLVDPGYRPPQTTEMLPSVGAGVVAVKVAEGTGPAPALPPVKTLHFSGYDWTVRTAGSYRGGSHNSFDPANAWTDEKGTLRHQTRCRLDVLGSQTYSQPRLRNVPLHDPRYFSPRAVHSSIDVDLGRRGIRR
jgi:hypothetical protein